MSQQSFPPSFNVYIPDAPDTTPDPYSLNSKVLLGAIIGLFLVIFLILMLHVYAKWFLQRSARPYVLSGGITSSSRAAAASAHNNTGLDKAAIAQLPTFVYTATSHVDNLEAGKQDESVARPALECAVCLSEFQENEKGRMLLNCKHSFHTECIDMWFLSHSTCPLCRTKVVLEDMATSTEASSTDAQHQEHEAGGPSLRTAEGNPVLLHGGEYPCNVLFWGNQTQMQISSQESSFSPSQLSPSSQVPSTRARLPQITIDIPSIEDTSLVSASGVLSAKCTTEQEACSSQPLKSPGLRASIKRILSRQSSRQKSSNQEGYEESPK